MLFHTIKPNPEHLFYTIDGEWVEAGELKIGDEIRRLDGDYGAVEIIVHLTIDGELIEANTAITV